MVKLREVIGKALYDGTTKAIGIGVAALYVAGFASVVALVTDRFPGVRLAVGAPWLVLLACAAFAVLLIALVRHPRSPAPAQVEREPVTRSSVLGRAEEEDRVPPFKHEMLSPVPAGEIAQQPSKYDIVALPPHQPPPASPPPVSIRGRDIVPSDLDMKILRHLAANHTSYVLQDDIIRATGASSLHVEHAIARLLHMTLIEGKDQWHPGTGEVRNRRFKLSAGGRQYLVEGGLV